MGKAEEDRLRAYTGDQINLVSELGLATPDDPGITAVVPGSQEKARADLRFGQQQADRDQRAADRQARLAQMAQQARARGEMQRARELQREADAAAQERKTNLGAAGKALSFLSRGNAKAGSLPTPGGVGALLMLLLGLVALIVPVVYSSDGTSSYTRFQLFWLTLIGRTYMASTGAITGAEIANPGQLAPGNPAPLPVLVPGTIVGFSATTNQQAVAKAGSTALASGSSNTNALPASGALPYSLGGGQPVGALPRTLGY